MVTGTREVQQEPRHDTRHAGPAIHPPPGHEPSFAVAELDCFAREREGARVPVAIEQQLEGPKALVGGPVARVEFSLPVVLADPAGPSGNHSELKVLRL